MGLNADKLHWWIVEDETPCTPEELDEALSICTYLTEREPYDDRDPCRWPSGECECRDERVERARELLPKVLASIREQRDEVKYLRSEIDEMVRAHERELEL